MTLVGKPTEKSHDPVGIPAKKVMTLYEIREETQLYQVNFGQKNHNPSQNRVKNL